MYSLQQYLRLVNSPGTAHEGLREEIINDDPTRNIFSTHKTKWLLETLTGVVPELNDMCPKGCCAYTGPFADMDYCHYCPGLYAD
jgi:hypothetical protein